MEDHEYDLTRKADIKEWLSDENNEERLMQEWENWFKYATNIPYDLEYLDNPADEKEIKEVRIKMYRSMKYLWEIINKLQTTYPKLIFN